MKKQLKDNCNWNINTLSGILINMSNVLKNFGHLLMAVDKTA